MPRARAVIVQNGAVALIERCRSDRHSYVVPGGGVEPGESPQEAAAREALEELGLDVEIGPFLADLPVEGDVQRFFLATVVGGEFGSGRGSEMVGRAGPHAGTYRPVWVPVGDLPHLPVFPRMVADLVARVEREHIWGRTGPREE